LLMYQAITRVSKLLIELSQNQVSTKDRIRPVEDNLASLLELIGRHGHKSSALLGLKTSMLGTLTVLIESTGTHRYVAFPALAATAVELSAASTGLDLSPS